MDFKKIKSNRGQAMILTVLMIGGILLMATTVAGLLMFYQIQQSTDFGESTKAIYAADAGLERAIYYYFYDFNYSDDGPCSEADPCTEADGVPVPSLENGASVSIEMIVPPPTVTNPETVITARANSGRTNRILQTVFRNNPYGL